MTYLATPAESPLYDADASYTPNYLRVFALQPEAYAAWQQLAKAVSGGMDLRRYELATVVAAKRLGSDYCTLAHSKVLRERFYDEERLRAIVADHRTAGLDPVDVAVMDFAEKVAADPTTVTEADVAALRGHGLSEQDVLQVVLAVCVRRFFSGVLSAVGADPDPALLP
ncbi:carboxymuconolactone decarboxylase family protein [Catellatospora sp. KI3]|uniref:carboxymuconolactone decarboxylase family protein n=1 Tax=Catellatospora sp. KI3 TaxID=3041620 RepID=UPI0024826C88|nr:carboxymuconolactone decarboxylase family protein [Catellatospora sp. KI3]MDI1461627.1 carboxymuconolactone decarboxylase family protein [Catellatospora sp. KI3]